MGVFDRMNRVISSNFNALLDKAQDPKKSIELTLQQMREQLHAARREVVSSVAAEKQLRNKVEQLDSEVDRWAQRAELAVRHQDDKLAREALTHKRRLQADRDRAEGLRAEQRSSALEMKAELERMEHKIEELEAKKGTLATQARQARTEGGAQGLGAPQGGSAFTDFRRMEDQIEGVETAAAAQREVDEALGAEQGPAGMTREQVEARFRELEQGGGAAPSESEPSDAVDEELSALKRKVRIKT